MAPKKGITTIGLSGASPSAPAWAGDGAVRMVAEAWPASIHDALAIKARRAAPFRSETMSHAPLGLGAGSCYPRATQQPLWHPQLVPAPHPSQGAHDEQHRDAGAPGHHCGKIPMRHS